MDQRTIAAVYPDQPPEIAATVWYNNQVSPASTSPFVILWFLEFKNSLSLSLSLFCLFLPFSLLP